MKIRKSISIKILPLKNKNGEYEVDESTRRILITIKGYNLQESETILYYFEKFFDEDKRDYFNLICVGCPSILNYEYSEYYNLDYYESSTEFKKDLMDNWKKFKKYIKNKDLSISYS